jgi:hypothetical protein
MRVTQLLHGQVSDGSSGANFTAWNFTWTRIDIPVPEHQLPPGENCKPLPMTFGLAEGIFGLPDGEQANMDDVISSTKLSRSGKMALFRRTLLRRQRHPAEAHFTRQVLPFMRLYWQSVNRFVDELCRRWYTSLKFTVGDVRIKRLYCMSHFQR